MATIKKQSGKGGTSYYITVCYGRDGSGKQLRHYKTYTPPANWSEARAFKEATRQAGLFEEEIKKGFDLDNRQSFEEYAGYVLELKRRQGVKESTLERYTELLTRINPVIGYLKLVDIRPAHLNNFYSSLLKEGSRRTGGRATAKIDLKAELKRQGMTQAALAERAGVGINTIAQAFSKPIAEASAVKIAAALGKKPERLFTIQRNTKPLSEKTVLEYHRLISTILSCAEKEMLVPYNAAAKATPPRPKKHEPNYFQPETVHAILDAADLEPLKYRVFINLITATGARRGELAGLKWEKVDLQTGQLLIDCGLYYSPKRGVYEGDTKTGERRSMKLPAETLALLKQLRREQIEQRFRSGDYWRETGYVFTQDNGEPMNPQTWTKWLNDFSIRHDLPHINPHAFRHTAASVLIANGTDITTVSKMLGHASVTTTEGFYSHLIEEAKAAASDTIADVLIRRKA
jgi:integrase